MDRVPHIGEIFALAAPLCWSVAVILFRKTGEVVPPLALNLFKNLLAILLFALTILAAGQPLLRDFPRGDYLLLLASGAIGIGLSDTFFFVTLNKVGAGLQAILNTSYSPWIILLSYIFLGERLTLWQWMGVAVILSAVFSIGRARGGPLPHRELLRGVLWGMLFTSTQAVSIVMVKPQLEGYPLLWANFWRLLGGTLLSIVLALILPRARRSLVTLRQVRVWPAMIPGSVMGTYVSLLFWLGGMKYTLASTAAALNQTATLWTFALAVLWLGEPVARRRLLWLASGLVGVALVTFG